MSSLYSIIAIVLPLLIMVVLIWKKVHITVAAVVCTGLMALMSGLNVFESITNDYMKAFVNYIQLFWPLIFLGATFGNVMQITGAANDVAQLFINKFGSKNTIVVLCVTTLVLAYGGVSCYVIVFAMYPIALKMFKEANLPRHLIPGIVAAGAFTAVNLGPGSPSVVNNIPTQYLGTNAMSAPLMALILAAFFFIIATIYCVWQERVARRKGEHFSANEETLALMEKAEKREHGSGFKALIPLALVVGPLILRVNVLYCLLFGIISSAVLYWKNIDNKFDFVNCGVGDAMGAIVATSAVVGFGGVASLTPGFDIIVDYALNMDGSPYTSFAVATSLLAGASGSGSGGLSLALSTLGDKYIAMGVDPGALHKVAAAACITLDSLPHNGVMVTVLAACGLTHREGYRHLFAITVVEAIIVMILAIILANIMYPVV